MVSTILEQCNEDRCWSLYLAVSANPIATHLEYGDFKDRYFGRKNGPAADKSVPEGQARDLVDQAQRVLSQFQPGDGGE